MNLKTPFSSSRFRCGTTILPRSIAPIVIAASVVACASAALSACAAERQALRKHPWTLEEASAQLRLYPRDAYLQYVVALLERQSHGNENTQAEPMGPFARQSPGRGAGVDLFSLFSGASAVQESLQLDTLHGDVPQRQPQTFRRGPNRGSRSSEQPGDRASQPKSVKIATLAGPTVQSHPWERMLAGRKPPVSPLAKRVPADFYFVQFHSLEKLIDALDTGDLWGKHLFSQAWQEARTQLFATRLHRQLAVETSPLLRPFYDSVVSEVAVTGSDLFVREGSDVTLLFRFRNSDLFHARMDSFLTSAANSHADARRRDGEYQGVRYVEVTTPDRSVHVFSAYPEPDLHVRSNSRMALERVIDAIHAKDAAGRPVTRLGDTPEFAYIRTLMPEGASEEDGFIYLSDPFIRRLVGPELKLAERRRMVCYNHLRMIGHAALFYQTQQGKPAASLADLDTAHCSPGEFGKGSLACPDGGTYTLAPDGLTAVCSHHGRAQSLIPCCEIPLAEVTREEAEEYNAFLAGYNQYWRTYFDPIAVRIQVRPERYRIETIVLPLIGNSLYSALAQTTAGPPETLDALPDPNRNIFSVAVRLHKLAVARFLGVESLLESPKSDESASEAASRDTEQAVSRLRQLAIAWHNYHDVFRAFPTSEPRHNQPAKKSGLSWRVHLLPFIGQQHLFTEFHLNEPWDSKHNKGLIARMPALYRPREAQLAAQGKTRIVAPLGDQLLSSKTGRPARIRDVTDGTSSTIMLVEADDRHAVVWTKPDDLEVDLARPLAGLAIRPPGGFLVVMADGQVAFLRSTIKPARLAALFTRAGGETIEFDPHDRIAVAQPRSRGGLFGSAENFWRPLKINELLGKGIGDQVGLHIYDSDPLFSFSLPAVLGMALGNFGGPDQGGFAEGNEVLLIGLVISALQSPVYISLPVRDAKIVDDFLARLDRQLAALARQGDTNVAFFQISQDFYLLRQSDVPIRAYAFQLGPIKWRLFWARIGSGLYIATKPFILEDLAALNSNSQPLPNGGEQKAHAMVRMRPDHWQRVMSSYKLGWAENDRAACLHNLGPLSSLARVVVPANRKPGVGLPAEVRQLGETIYDTHFYCPDGGRYIFDADGSVACTLHGSALAPRQSDTPSPKSDLGQLLDGFADMTLLLTLGDDGLHAVVTIDRKKVQ